MSRLQALIRAITCKWCKSIFFICRSCFRGQVYCCEFCRKISRKIAHRQAQSTYITSDKGRKANRLAAQRRRIKNNRKTVADQPTTKPKFRDILLFKSSINKFCCAICGVKGKLVKRFPRRGYGKPVASTACSAENTLHFNMFNTEVP